MSGSNDMGAPGLALSAVEGADFETGDVAV